MSAREAPAASGPAAPRAFAAFEWLLAARYLRARRAGGFVSVIAGFSFLGILLGVGTLIVVMSVMNGFRQELLDKILGLNGHAFVQGIEEPFTDYEAVAGRLRGVPGVRQVIPLVEGQALVSSPLGSSGVLVRGIAPADLKALPSIAGGLKGGSLDAISEEAPALVLGRRLADQLGVRAGDNVSLVAPRGAATAFGTAPRIKAYPVAAVYEIGMSEFDAAFAFLPIEEASAYFNRDGEASVIEVFVDRPDQVGVVAEAMEAAAGRRVAVTDWRQRNRTFFGALEVERNVMFLILSLIVLVAALNIVSGLVMLVKDKSRDIAVLRTMGATRGAIMRVFVLTGAAIGVAGTLAGLLVGLLVARNVEAIRGAIFPNTFPKELYFLSRLPSQVDGGQVLAVVAMALVLSLLATLPPAWRAARLDPVEALRYE